MTANEKYELWLEKLPADDPLRKELEAGRQAARLLGGRLEMPVSCAVAGREWEHMIQPVRKTEKTASAYPRKAGIPKTKPLGE